MVVNLVSEMKAIIYMKISTKTLRIMIIVDHEGTWEKVWGHLQGDSQKYNRKREMRLKFKVMAGTKDDP